MSGESSKAAPCIIITGTPGTGKTTHAQLLAEESPIPLKHINVGDLVKEKGLYEEYDEEWQSYTVDEDKVRNNLPCEEILNQRTDISAVRRTRAIGRLTHAY